MNTNLKKALKSATLSAGKWADGFNEGGCVATNYPPYVPAGIKTLRRSGRPDLIPALRRRCDSRRYDVISLEHAKSLWA